MLIHNEALYESVIISKRGSKMKKHVLFIATMLTISSSASMAMSSTQIADFYTKSIRDTFYRDFKDKDSFFYFLNETMTPALINWCNKAATDVKLFVSNHSKNFIGIKDSLLNNTAASFEKLHLDTVNSIKVAKIVVSSKPNRESLIQQYNVFEKRLKPQCATLITQLKQDYFTISDKQASQALLLRVLGTLQDLIQLAQSAVKYHIDHL